jgi:hypothetical protein
MSEDDQHRATELLKELYVAGHIDQDRFDSGVAADDGAWLMAAPVPRSSAQAASGPARRSPAGS